MPQPLLPLYPRLMGEAFARLPVAVQRFHRLQGAVELHGEVETWAPVSPMGRALAFLLGAPLRGARGPLRFALQASASRERWTRHFPGRTMASELSESDGYLEEELGTARLRFVLQHTEEGLIMQLQRLWMLGVPCPRWMMPRVVAREFGEGNVLFFHVEATLPVFGRVVRYVGHLVMPPLRIADTSTG